MRTGPFATVAVLSMLALDAKAFAQVPDLPPINEGSAEQSPMDRPMPQDLAAPVVPDATLPGALPGGVVPPADSGLAPLAPAALAAPAGPPLDVDRVMDRVKTCWTAIPKVYGTEAQGGVARIRLKFQSNGLLDGEPMIIDKPKGAVGAKFAESAAAAIQKCQPYQLPPERYAEWRLIEIRFDTIDPDNPPPPPPAPAPPAPGETAPAPAVQPGGTLQGLPPGDGYVPSVPAPAQTVR